MSDNIIVRMAEADDAEAIAEFNVLMAMETEEKKLDGDIVLSGVRSLMKRPELGFYLIAEMDGKVAGGLMVTTEWSDWRNGLFWWVQSVFVKPEFRRLGVYRRMYTEVKEMARKMPEVCGYRLYVEKDNVRARQTYEALGMTEIPYRMYEEEV